MTELALSLEQWLRVSKPRMMLDWCQRSNEGFIVGIQLSKGRTCDRSVHKTQEEAERAAVALQLENPENSVVWWPPRNYVWWTDRAPRRLPLYGQTDIDRAVTLALDDCNFGSWLIRSKSNLDNLWPIVELYESAIGCPSMASINEIDDLIARGSFGEFVLPEDQVVFDRWGEKHERDHEMDCDCDYPGRPFADRVFTDMLDSDEAEDPDHPLGHYVGERAEWLLHRVSLELGRQVTDAELEHTCDERFPAIDAPDSSGVYAVEGAGGYIKIGKAKNIGKRLGDLQVAHPVRLKLLAVLSEDPKDEGGFHKALKESRVVGEWFRPSPEVLAVIAKSRGMK